MIFPEKVKHELKEKYPDLNPKYYMMAFDATEQYFQLHKKYPKKFLYMPSEVADLVWHGFILHTREYMNYCEKEFGEYFHHSPFEIKPKTAKEKAHAKEQLIGLYMLACQHQDIDLAKVFLEQDHLFDPSTVTIKKLEKIIPKLFLVDIIYGEKDIRDLQDMLVEIHHQTISISSERRTKSKGLFTQIKEAFTNNKAKTKENMYYSQTSSSGAIDTTMMYVILSDNSIAQAHATSVASGFDSGTGNSWTPSTSHSDFSSHAGSGDGGGDSGGDSGSSNSSCGGGCGGGCGG